MQLPKFLCNFAVSKCWKTNKVIDKHYPKTDKAVPKDLSYAMKRIRLICLSAIFALGLNAQVMLDSHYGTIGHIKSDGTIQDNHYSTIGHIKDDGTVQDEHYSTIGHIKSDGTIQDSHYSTIGYVKEDGTIQDSHYSTIGHIKDDGTVQDEHYSTIGHANGIPRTWTALFFFFFAK